METGIVKMIYLSRVGIEYWSGIFYSTGGISLAFVIGTEERHVCH